MNAAQFWSTEVFELSYLSTKIICKNSENCGHLRGNKFDLEKVKGECQGHEMVQIERACHKDHACQVSMPYRLYFRGYDPG